MRISSKKVMYLYNVLTKGLIDNMTRYRMVEDLKSLGITIDENSPLNVDIIRAIYKRLCTNLCKKYDRMIIEGLEKEKAKNEKLAKRQMERIKKVQEREKARAVKRRKFAERTAQWRRDNL